MRKRFVVLAGSVLLCSMAYAQDQPASSQDQQESAPSLGEIARQLKLKRQQREAQEKAKETSSQDAQPSESTSAAPAKIAQLVTHDDTPERAAVTTVSAHPDAPQPDPPAVTADREAKGQNWRSQILAQKKGIADLEQDIKTVGGSIHFAGANCVANCAEWNERQQQKQNEVDTMKAQLDEAKKQLKEMQESARKDGFASLVDTP